MLFRSFGHNYGYDYQSQRRYIGAGSAANVNIVNTNTNVNTNTAFGGSASASAHSSAIAPAPAPAPRPHYGSFPRRFDPRPMYQQAPVARTFPSYGVGQDGRFHQQGGFSQSRPFPQQQFQARPGGYGYRMMRGDMRGGGRYSGRR